MGNSARPWFEELTVTPLITHAVEKLRAVIPRDDVRRAGGIGFVVSDDKAHVFGDKSQRTDDVRMSLTYSQRAAVLLLAAVAAYHEEHLTVMYCEKEGEDIKLTPAYFAAKKRFEDDVRRKLNIEIEGYVSMDKDGGEGDHMTGSVTVYL